MRRAILLLVVAVAIGLAFSPPPAFTAAVGPLNGIGLIDYSQKPTFKIGDWAKYRMSGKSELGMKDNYVVTVLIAGEQDFWGDPAFWIETWTDAPGLAPQTQAALMSYDIFGDTSAVERLQLYERAMVTMLNEDGTPQIDINKPAASMLKTRREVKQPIRYSRDTLGVDTVQTPRGTLQAMKVLRKEGTSATQMVGDSSVYNEVRENRTSWYTNEVPITHIAREDVENIAAHKAWLVGRSGDANPLTIKDRGFGTARLIDYGHGLEARLIPARYRKTIAEQEAPQRAASRTQPAAAGKTRARPGR